MRGEGFDNGPLASYLAPHAIMFRRRAVPDGSAWSPGDGVANAYSDGLDTGLKS